MTSTIGSLLAEACELAEAAGSLTLEWFRQPELEIAIKDDGTEVTAADRAAERFIREELARRHPHHAVYGEEEGGAITASGLSWIIDPIDGTRGFVRGVPLYATLLAVVDDEGPLIGVIHIPALHSTIGAGRGVGCWLDGQQCRVSERSGVAGSLVNTSSYETFSNEALLGLKESGALMRTWGDAYGYYLVASGQAEAMVDPICSPWDLAPMPVIIGEAGGTFTDVNGGKELDLRAPADSVNGVASNGLIHDQLLDALRCQ
ncbi:MAG: histidinol phosphate phosphatase [Acidimicrobiaceae bacterium]|nr:histidinol phosphate phosphatase [Acidimicrobiaceae bacterium]